MLQCYSYNAPDGQIVELFHDLPISLMICLFLIRFFDGFKGLCQTECDEITDCYEMIF